MLSSWWSRTPKLLVFAGLFALAFAMYAAYPQSVTANLTTGANDFYPGPCASAPKDVVIHYHGGTSGCTDTNGKACQPGEVIEFTATSATYNFAVCDTFTWTFGDGTVQTTLWPSVTRQFTGNGSRTVSLSVSNSFATGGVKSGFISVPPAAVSTCSTSSNTLCFGSNRFRVTLDAVDDAKNRTSSGKSTTGEASAETSDTGYFTLKDFTGNTDNPEVVIKVFDFGGNPLMLFGALTDTEVFANVYDTQTGTNYQLHKASDVANGGFALGNSGQQPTETCPSPAVSTVATGGSTAACSANTTTLCQNGGKFAVTVKATDPNDKVVFDANTHPKNDLFGFFFFPKTGGPTNLEVFSKVVGPIPGLGNLVFYGGLTSLDYTITYREVATGKTKTYHKAANSACGGFDVF